VNTPAPPRTLFFPASISHSPVVTPPRMPGRSRIACCRLAATGRTIERIGCARGNRWFAKRNQSSCLHVRLCLDCFAPVLHVGYYLLTESHESFGLGISRSLTTQDLDLLFSTSQLPFSRCSCINTIVSSSNVLADSCACCTRVGVVRYDIGTWVQIRLGVDVRPPQTCDGIFLSVPSPRGLRVGSGR